MAIETMKIGDTRSYRGAAPFLVVGAMAGG
jgi:hypothetical protein